MTEFGRRDFLKGTVAGSVATTGSLITQAQAQTPAPATPAGFVAREALADLGLESPEAAVQTFFRALRDGDVQRMHDCTGDARLTPIECERRVGSRRKLGAFAYECHDSYVSRRTRLRNYAAWSVMSGNSLY